MNTQPLNAHVTVAALIEKNNKFLMVEEISDGLTVINQPAGHVEHGESFIDAVIRETREETAWQFMPRTLLGIYRWVHPQTSATYYRHCFTGEASMHDNQQALDEGIIRALWLSYEEILELKQQMRSPLVLMCIDDYLAGKSYPLGIYTDVP